MVVDNPPVYHPIRPDAKGIVRLYRDGRSHPVSMGRLYLQVFPDAADLRRAALPAAPAVAPAEPPAPATVPRFVPLEPVGHDGSVVGSRHGRAKLDEAKVLEARRLRRAGHTFAELAERYGVSPGTMLAAVSGKTWAHVPMEPD